GRARDRTADRGDGSNRGVDPAGVGGDGARAARGRGRRRATRRGRSARVGRAGHRREARRTSPPVRAWPERGL
ncbi:MAG: hypothetical protein AVDCRST_MAG39-2446, partial [uncultured Sphingomonadaceae bacterium]